MSTQTGATAPATARSTRSTLRRGWRSRLLRGVLLVVLIELVHAVVVLPVALALLAVSPLLPVLVTVAAELRRLVARRLGADAPSGWVRAAGSPLTQQTRQTRQTWRAQYSEADATPSRQYRRPGLPWWLASRVASAPFWRQDLPLVAAGLLTDFLALVGTLLGLNAVLLIIAPVGSALGGSFHMTIGDTALTSPAQLWWTPLVGTALAACTLMALSGTSRMRLRVASALSRDREAERVEALNRQVGHLRQGQATLVNAFDVERQRIERDLHDGAQQRLTAVTMILGAARLSAETLRPGDAGSPEPVPRPEPATSGGEESREAWSQLLARLELAQEQAETALRELRATVRSVSPAVLRDHGLAAGVRDLCAGSGISVTLTVSGEDSHLTAPSATAVYFAVSEALTNVARHSGRDEAHVTVTCSPAGVKAEVRDEGVGGAPETLSAETGAQSRSHGDESGDCLSGRGSGTGLAGLAHRLESVGGSLAVVSPRGGGTVVTIQAPATPPW